LPSEKRAYRQTFERGGEGVTGKRVSVSLRALLVTRYH
jgi:hypothetical protein